MSKFIECSLETSHGGKQKVTMNIDCIGLFFAEGNTTVIDYKCSTVKENIDYVSYRSSYPYEIFASELNKAIVSDCGVYKFPPIKEE